MKSCKDINFKFQIETSKMANNSHMHGVYRQRSCDNLQNGKFSYVRRSAHLSPILYPLNDHNVPSSSMNNILNKKFSLNLHSRPLEHNAIPKNFKFVSPQSKCDGLQFDANSLPRYPTYYRSPHYQFDRSTLVEYYRYDAIRHPTTPPPPPPLISPSIEKQMLLPTPTSSSSGENFYSSTSEYDPMIASKQNDQIHYRCRNKQFLEKSLQRPIDINSSIETFTSFNSPYRNLVNSSYNNYQNLQHANHNPNKRNSNIYEYRFCSLELNAFQEDDRNTS